MSIQVSGEPIVTQAPSTELSQLLCPRLAEDLTKSPLCQHPVSSLVFLSLGIISIVSVTAATRECEMRRRAMHVTKNTYRTSLGCDVCETLGSGLPHSYDMCSVQLQVAAWQGRGK